MALVERTRVGAFMLVALAAVAAHGQSEPLSLILQRGFVGEWLVCAPLPADVEGGVAAALRRGGAPLGNVDHLAPMDGVARAKPRHLAELPTEDGESRLWQYRATADERLDIASHFPSAAEGVAYAAFYAQAVARQQVYFDLQSTLGARVWLNGLQIRALTSAPLSGGGPDRFLAVFEPGENVVIVEFACVALGVLAEIAGMPVDSYASRAFRSRPLLAGTDGYTLALRLWPVAWAGPVVYVPALEATGGFAGSDLAQNVRLTLFNPSNSVSPPVAVSAFLTTGGPRVDTVVPPIEPMTQAVAEFDIHPGQTAPGTPVPVNVTLTVGDATAQFTDAANVLPPAVSGTVYIVTGRQAGVPAGETQRDAWERRHGEIARHILLMRDESRYGFHLGTGQEWRAYVQTHPDERDYLQAAVMAGRCAPGLLFADSDQRLVHGETIIRSIAYGRHAAQAVLGAPGDTCYAWNSPGVMPQFPQLLRDAFASGIVSNLSVPGVPPLFLQRALDGSLVLHRRIRETGPAPATAEELRNHAEVSRGDLLSMRIPIDVFVLESALPPPEPFFLDKTRELAESQPSLRVSGAGGARFFQEAPGLESAPVFAEPLAYARLDELVAQPDLKRALAHAETKLVSGETFATFAALQGARFPYAPVDYAWRQILFASEPLRAGLSRSPQVYLDTLAALRQAYDSGESLLLESTRYLASQADTYSGAPEPRDQLALVVFNPSAWPRTDTCALDLELPSATGLALVDAGGNQVPLTAGYVHLGPDRRIVRAFVEFAAADVPALGYKTYYLQPQGPWPTASRSPGSTIENEYFRIAASAGSGGTLSGVFDKAAETELAPAVGNLLATWQSAGTAAADWQSIAQAATLEVVESPAYQRLIITTPLPGCTVTREITLWQGVRRIDCRLQSSGLPEGAALGVTFSTPAPDAAYTCGERFGSVSLPKQGDGASLYPVHGWVAQSRPAEAGKEAPGLAVFFDQPVLAGRSADGVFSAVVGGAAPGDAYEPGSGISLRYALYPFTGAWQDAAVPMRASEFANVLYPVVTDLHLGRLDATASFLEFSEPGLVVTGVKLAGYSAAALETPPEKMSRGFVVRAYEPLGRTWRGTLRSSIPIRAANWADVLDDPGAPLPMEGGAVAVEGRPFQVLGVLVRPSVAALGPVAAELPVADVHPGPVFSRFWRHNAGAEPPGAFPVAVMLEGDLAGGGSRAAVTAINNTKTPLSGNVYVSVPEGWTANPQIVPYVLEPGASARTDLIVLRPGDAVPGAGIVVRAQAGEKTVQDVLVLGEDCIELAIVKLEAEFALDVVNRGALTAEGHLDLIVPTLFWRAGNVRPEATVTPHRWAVSIPPYESQRYFFRITGGLPRHLDARLGANGRVVYARWENPEAN